MKRNWTEKLVFTAFALFLNGAALFAEEYDFNKGWLFLQRDTKMPRLTYLDHKDFICNSKGGAAFKADPVCGFAFDDKDFKVVGKHLFGWTHGVDVVPGGSDGAVRFAWATTLNNNWDRNSPIVSQVLVRFGELKDGKIDDISRYIWFKKQMKR